MTRDHLEAKSERVTMHIPPHLRAAWHRRGPEWMLKLLEVAAQSDINRVVTGFAQSKGKRAERLP